MIEKMIQSLGNRMEAQIEKIQEMFNKDLEELNNKQTEMNNTITEMKNTVKDTNTWRLNITLLNNQEITEEIKEEI